MGIPKPLNKEQAPVELHKIYDVMHESMGKMPNVFGVVARFPAALKTLIQFYDAVMSTGKIDAKYKELAYLKTSSINACRYWTVFHTASAKQAGVTDEQIQALRFYQRSEAFDEKEKTTIRFADIVTRGAAAVDAEVLKYVEKFYSEDEIVELTMVIALANMVNRINDALEIEPDMGWGWAAVTEKAIIK
jgi:uncharacterized peroxidase-related enzyme